MLKMSKKDKSKIYYRQGTDVSLEGTSQPKFICYTTYSGMRFPVAGRYMELSKSLPIALMLQLKK